MVKEESCFKAIAIIQATFYDHIQLRNIPLLYRAFFLVYVSLPSRTEVVAFRFGYN